MAENKVYLDLSRLDAEQKAQYDALVAKASVDPEAAKKEMEDEEPTTPKKDKNCKKDEVDDMDDMGKKKCKKSDPETSPEIQKALEEMQALKKSFEMKEMTEVAKKYAPLGKKEDELAQTLYDMKKSNEANYNAYIAILDESLGLVEKSGLFNEIGKSAGGQGSANSAVDKADAKAKEIMKSDPKMDYTTAIAKAWEDPDLMAEYDAEYHNK